MRFIKDKNQDKKFHSTNDHDDLEGSVLSKRWIVAIGFAASAASCLLILSLLVASHGRIQLAKMPESDTKLLNQYTKLIAQIGKRADRLALTVPLQRFENKKQFDFSTEAKVNGKTLLRPQKFEFIHISLSESRSDRFKYPSFNALSLFGDDQDGDNSNNIENIYNKKVSSEFLYKKVRFDTSNLRISDDYQISDKEAKLHAKKSFSRFSENTTNIDNLQYRYINKVNSYLDDSLNSDSDTKNSSSLQQSDDKNSIYSFDEDLIAWSPNQKIIDALHAARYNDKLSADVARSLNNFASPEQLRAGGIIRLGLDSDEDGNETIVRASLYHKSQHLLTVALNDSDDFVVAQEPETTNILRKALSGTLPTIKMAKGRVLPIYDTIYRAALSYGLSVNTIQRLLRIIASNIDLESATSDTDTLDIFYPISSKKANGKDNPAGIMYVKAFISGKIHKYYRYKSMDGHIDYYDENGKSPKQFLLRKPVPNGHFSSPFGFRRHPILGYLRMHTGVDWAAPLHSIIVAAGDGVVTKRGPTPGYGNHTEIQHANGYMTSYSHQSGFAAGIAPGVHVKQGQIIGYIGSTGLSTGAHCHFEIVVNGIKVNPMRVHLPHGKELKNRDLQLFQKKRNSIDAVLSENRV